MNEGINFFVGLDVHKDTIALAICEPGREPSRFVGTIGADAQGVIKTLRKYGTPSDVTVVYEAGPSYDKAERYMVIQLKTAYYHYWDIDAATVQGLQGASLKRPFFEARIRGSGVD
jgi:hypothetical protein